MLADSGESTVQVPGGKPPQPFGHLRHRAPAPPHGRRPVVGDELGNFLARFPFPQRHGSSFTNDRPAVLDSEAAIPLEQMPPQMHRSAAHPKCRLSDFRRIGPGSRTYQIFGADCIDQNASARLGGCCRLAPSIMSRGRSAAMDPFCARLLAGITPGYCVQPHIRM